MLIATDPLSLFFITAFLLGLVFFLILALIGNLGHGATDHVSSQHGGIHLHVHAGAGHGVGHASGHAQTSAGAHNTAQQGASNRASENMIAHSQQSTSHQHASLLGYLNPTAIFLFLFGFGLFGYLFHNLSHLFVALTLSIAIVGGLFVTFAILAILERIFGDSEGNTIQDVSDRTGLIGKVIMTIPQSGIGEILYSSPGGMRKSIPARSVLGERLERDQEVVVVQYQQGVAEVDTWDHFMNETNHATPTDSHIDELDELRALLDEAEKNASPETPIYTQKDTPKE